MVYLLSGSFGGIFHVLMKTVKDEAGEETARKIAERAGRSVVSNALSVGMKTLGTNVFTPEQWSWYQDIRHARAGIEGAQAYNEYDDEKCVVKREHCFFYTEDPEVKEFCKYFCLGGLKVYRETQPGLDVELTKCMPDGDDHCEHVFIPPKRPTP